MTELAGARRGTLSAELRAAAVIVAALAVVGVVAGAVWSWWSPPGPRAFVIGPGLIQPDETEAFVAGDGRFGLIAIVVGVLAALAAWSRPAIRGPMTVLALAVGSLLGALLTELVGRWSAGGTNSGPTGTVLAQLRLTLHMHGLYFLEAAVAVLVYGVCVSFAAADDLGRPDPARDLARGSVRPDVELQDAGGYRDGAGAAQEGGFAPQ